MGTHPIFESDFDCLTEHGGKMEDPRRRNYNQQTTGVRLQDHRNRDRQGSVGGAPPNPDMDPVNFVKDLKPTTKNANLTVIILSISQSMKTQDGNELRNVIVGDKTGKVSFSVWGEHGNHMNVADILRITKAYTKIFKGALTLYMSKQGDLRRVGEFCLQVNEKNDMSDTQRDWTAFMGDVPGGAGNQGFQRQNSNGR